MQISFAFFLSSLAGLVFAQNPFLYNPGDLTSITAGSTFTIAWAPSTGTTDTITILLRQGDPSSLITVLTIASSIPNTGSYTWAVPSTLVNGDLYTFEIYDDKNHDLANYSNQFTIVSTNTVSSVIAQPVATTTGKDGFASTVYGVASVSATSTAGGKGTATAVAASASTTAAKNGGMRMGGMEVGLGLGVVAGIMVGL